MNETRGAQAGPRYGERVGRPTGRRGEYLGSRSRPVRPTGQRSAEKCRSLTSPVFETCAVSACSPNRQGSGTVPGCEWSSARMQCNCASNGRSSDVGSEPPGSSSRDNFADDRPCIWPSGFVATVRVPLVWAVTQWKGGCGVLVLVGRRRS